MALASFLLVGLESVDVATARLRQIGLARSFHRHLQVGAELDQAFGRPVVGLQDRLALIMRRMFSDMTRRFVSGSVFGAVEAVKAATFFTPAGSLSPLEPERTSGRIRHGTGIGLGIRSSEPKTTVSLGWEQSHVLCLEVCGTRSSPLSTPPRPPERL
jgi:hypothetical protein